MANPEWLETFRSFTPEELAAHITNLKSEMSVYASQNIGSKSYSKDLAELRSQLSSAIRIQNERRLPHGYNPSIGITDFRNV